MCVGIKFRHQQNPWYMQKCVVETKLENIAFKDKPHKVNGDSSIAKHNESWIRMWNIINNIGFDILEWRYTK